MEIFFAVIFYMVHVIVCLVMGYMVVAGLVFLMFRLREFLRQYRVRRREGAPPAYSRHEAGEADNCEPLVFPLVLGAVGAFMYLMAVTFSGPPKGSMLGFFLSAGLAVDACLAVAGLVFILVEVVIWRVGAMSGSKPGKKIATE